MSHYSISHHKINSKQRDYIDPLAFENGLDALEKSSPAVAVNNFTILVERHPDSPQYRFLRGKAYFNLGCYEPALLDFRDAQKLGLKIPELLELTTKAEIRSEEPHEVKEYRPNLLDLVNLRRHYRIKSLLLSADEYLAEGNFEEVDRELLVAEKLMDHNELGSETGFKAGHLRARAQLAAGKFDNALETIDFHLRHAYSIGREDIVRQFKMLRSLCRAQS